MKYILSILLSGILFSFSQREQSTKTDALVKTDKGRISGTVNNSVYSYKSIPYAAPPVGDLRWKEPQSHAPWSDTLLCAQFGASAMQAEPKPFMMWTEEFIAPPEPLSEDCLTLNIWTKSKSSKEKLPVFVWIHGGALMSGAASCAVYDGEAMAQKGIVFVSINYRVGVFGFLSLSELSKESNNHASGNYGFMDQVAALKWIQKNISAFGGDPKNVTIAGQSAGSFSVNVLAATPLARGLFHKAIAQSGGLISGRPVKNLSDAEKSGEKLLQNANAKSLTDLRKLSAKEVMEAAKSLPFGSFSVVTDGYVLPSDVYTIFKNGQHNDVPLLTGWVTGDGALAVGQIASAEKFKENAKNTYGSRSEEFLTVFPATNDEQARTSQLKASLLSFAALPSHLWANFSKNKSYVYQFGHVPADKPDFPNYGAFHTSEVPYVLHTLSKWNRPWTAVDLSLEKTMSDYWINFIRTGNPNGKGLPAWNSYDKASGTIINFGDQVVAQPGLLQRELNFMEELSRK